MPMDGTFCSMPSGGLNNVPDYPSVPEVKPREQLKKFRDLEVSGLIDSKNESDVSENQIMKNFESDIKYDEKEKWYKVGLPRKLEANELKDNRKSQLFVNQALTITLKATKIFEDYSISLHKWQTNLKSLHKAWQDKEAISDENPHFETVEKDNLPYKFLEWLRLPPEFWPKSQNEDSPNVPDLEYRKSNDIVQHECIIEEQKSLFDISKYSNLEKVLRITVWQKRFIKLLKKSNILHGSLTSEELPEAERFRIQVEQEKFFPEELKSLKDNKIEKESPLYNYMPYLDGNGLIRLRGRLEFCNLSIDEKHPLILPQKIPG
ncbi:integrase catalytic domain-containing protein [Trichonephila clavipes]|nr:integrase catalytic domain-containing protein [Trichonephila clavipes]